VCFVVFLSVGSVILGFLFNDPLILFLRLVIARIDLGSVLFFIGLGDFDGLLIVKVAPGIRRLLLLVTLIGVTVKIYKSKDITWIAAIEACSHRQCYLRHRRI
jgi:hypothetical protein